MPDVISNGGDLPFLTSLTFAEINLKIFPLTTRKGLVKHPRPRVDLRSFLSSLGLHNIHSSQTLPMLMISCKISPTSSITTLRLLSQPNRHNKNEKLTTGWLGKFYYFSENAIKYTNAGIGCKNSNISNFTTKYAIWFSENPGCQKSHFKAHHHTTELTLSKPLLYLENRKSILASFYRSIGPSPFYLMALLFSQTMTKTTCLTIALRL